MTKFIFLLLLALCGNLFGGEVVNLFSGRECTLPGRGKWSLAAEHGRILASGTAVQDVIVLSLEAIKPGTSLDLTLRDSNGVRKLRFWSPEVLPGIAADFRMRTEQGKVARLKGLGLVEASGKSDGIVFTDTLEQCNGRLNFCFSEKSDYPLSIPEDWEYIGLSNDPGNRGSLSIVLNKEERVVDVDGQAKYLEIKKGATTIIVMGPENACENIDDVLLIKKIIAKEKRK